MNITQIAPTDLARVTLYYREGNSDKVYQCSIEKAGESFVVNFAFGRRGSTLNAGSKTSSPVGYDEARRIYDKLVREKKAKGYTEGPEGTPYLHSEKKPAGILPQLLNPIEESNAPDLITTDDWCAQEKFDGKRLLVRKQGAIIEGISKQGVVCGLSEPLFQVISRYGADAVLDGESVGEAYYAFDLLLLDGADIRDWPYRERLAALMNLLAPIEQRVIKLAETAFTREQKQNLWTRLRVNKKEGIVFKRVLAPYSAGRPSSGGMQLKLKFRATLSALVSKVNDKRSVELGLLGEDGWQNAGNVAIPPNQAMPQAGDIVEVRYLYAFPESGVLYQPVFLGMRTDVNAEECLASQLKFKPQAES